MRIKDGNVYIFISENLGYLGQALTVPPAPGLYMIKPSVSVVLSLKDTLPAMVDSHEGRTCKHCVTMTVK